MLASHPSGEPPVTEASIFAAAVDLADPAEREAYLAGACGADTALRARIDGLLAAHAAAGTFLERPAAPPPDPNTTWTATDGPPPDDGLPFLSPPRRPDSLGRLGHYEVLEVLGKGGFGIVFRAFDEVLQRVVAVKVLAPQMAATSPARKRFLREARSSAQVRHENVVAVHAVEEQPLPYLVMEFIPGETLQQRLDRTGPLDLPDILRIGRQIAEGLAAAHGTGLIHRDVKPANVMLEAGPRGRVKLTDFGLARAADDASLSQSGVVAGTPMYMAPEQARGDTLDHRADLFSLGSVLYVMCTGRPPFRASGTLAVLKRVCEEDPRPIREVIPEVPEWLCRIVEKLHAKDAAGRYQTAREVADVLADCERQVKEYGAVRDFGRIPGGRPRSGRRRWAWAAALALLLPLAAWGVYALTRPDAPESPTVPPGAGEVQVQFWDPELVVRVAGTGREFAGRGGLFVLAPGEHMLQAHKHGKVVYERTLSLRSGEHLIVTIGPDDLGWTPLFNGKDLAGWKTHPAAPDNWKVRDGVLVGTGGPSTLLTTARDDYRNFHLRVEVKIKPEGESGLYFRSQGGWGSGYEAQIAPANTTTGKTGTLSRFQGEKWVTLKRVDHDVAPADAWFVQEVIADGTRLVVRVNGQTVADVADGTYPRGCLALEAIRAGTVVEFRKVEVRELPPESPADGFTPLFNGKDLSGWKAHPDHPGTWRVDGGVLIGSAVRSHLFTERGDFTDFHLRAEVRIPKSGNSGLYFRSPFSLANGGFPPGHEVQIYNAERDEQGGGDPFKTGSLHNVWASPKGLVVGPEWFTLEVIARGNHVTTRVDGTTVFDGDLPPADARTRRSGHFALQAIPGEQVLFRKVEVKELPPADGFVSLFNGKDLSGWESTPPNRPPSWTVVNGVLSSIPSPKPAELTTVRDDFANFHLRAEARINDGGNSGIYFRFPPDNLWKPDVLEAEINCTAGSPRKTGSLWPLGVEQAVTDVLHKPDEWFALEILALGSDITIKVDGKVATHWIDPRPTYPKGRLRIQLSGNTLVQFRKIEVKELPAGGPPPAVAPFDEKQAKAHQEAWAKHLGVPVEFTNSVGMKLRLIPPGEFRMGYAPDQVKRLVAETEAGWERNVILTNAARPAAVPDPFYLGAHEVTVGQFRRFVEATKYKTTAERDGKGGLVYDPEKGFVPKKEVVWSYPWPGATDDHPVMTVTAEDAEAFCAWLGEAEGRTYAPPTDAQWEFACRAGTTTLWWTGDDPKELLRYERVGGGGGPRPVGSLSANPFGLSDMHGNVCELVQSPDGYRSRSAQAGVATRVSHSAWGSGVARDRAHSGTGFRVALVGDLKPKAPKTVDLLALIDPDRDALQGAWKWDGKVLDSPAPLAQLQVPFAPPEHYRLTMEVERTTPPGALTFGLIVGGKTACVTLDYNAPVKGGVRSGLAGLDGKVLHKREAAFDGPVLGPGRNTVVAEVRGTRVTVRVGETKVVDWEGDPDRFTVSPNMDKTDGKRLYLGHLSAGYRFHRLELTPLPPPDARPAVAPDPRPVP
ncbi:MAG: hypothetical protein C0501_07150 [Isosphaera sp.]|nr:hypothetical protein [Isosphaera sp.]